MIIMVINTIDLFQNLRRYSKMNSLSALSLTRAHNITEHNRAEQSRGTESTGVPMAKVSVANRTFTIDREKSSSTLSLRMGRRPRMERGMRIVP